MSINMLTITPLKLHFDLATCTPFKFITHFSLLIRIFTPLCGKTNGPLFRAFEKFRKDEFSLLVLIFMP